MRSQSRSFKTGVPPSIYGTLGLASLTTGTIVSENLQIGVPGEETGFFGKLSLQQNTSPASIEDLNSVYVDFGLFRYPWIQQEKLVGSNGATSWQGYSTSLSADGNTLAVGGNSNDGDIGATWIFIRSGSTWTQQGPRLVGSGGTGDQFQGYSVSLSADGNTLAVGGPTDNSFIGAVWIFVRSGSTWTQQGSKLVGTGGIGTSFQGVSVSLSADGNTLAVGGSTDNTQIGATWIFTRTSGVWTQQTKLVGTGGIGNQSQGSSVSINGDTLAVGGLFDNGDIGATWIFTRISGVWTQQAKLVGTGGAVNQYQGSSVSLKGNNLVVGGPGGGPTTGAVWVFTRTNSTWTQQGPKIIPNNIIGTNHIGSSVSLSDDGDTFAISNYNDSDFIGATWIFTRSEGLWTQNIKLIGAGYENTPPCQGYAQQSICLSSDASTLSVGGYCDDGNQGATWIFKKN